MQTFVSTALKSASPSLRVAFLDSLRTILSVAAPKSARGTALLSDIDLMSATHAQQCEALSAAKIPWGAPVEMRLLVGPLDLEVAQCGPDFLILVTEPPQILAPQIAWLLLSVHGETMRDCIAISAPSDGRRVSVQRPEKSTRA